MLTIYSHLRLFHNLQCNSMKALARKLPLTYCFTWDQKLMEDEWCSRIYLDGWNSEATASRLLATSNISALNKPKVVTCNTIGCQKTQVTCLWGRSTSKWCYPAPKKRGDNAPRRRAKIVPIMVHSNPIGKQRLLLVTGYRKWNDHKSSWNNYL